MPLTDTILRIDGQAVIVSSGEYDQRFTLVSRGASPVEGAATVVVFSEKTGGGYELTYDTASGRVLDVEDVAVEHEEHHAHA